MAQIPALLARSLLTLPLLGTISCTASENHSTATKVLGPKGGSPLEFACQGVQVSLYAQAQGSSLTDPPPEAITLDLEILPSTLGGSKAILRHSTLQAGKAADAGVVELLRHGAGYEGKMDGNTRVEFRKSGDQGMLLVTRKSSGRYEALTKCTTARRGETQGNTPP